MYMNRSVYLRAADLIKSGNIQSAEKYLLEYTNSKPFDSSKVQKMFTRSRVCSKNHDIMPSVVMLYYWKALAPSYQAETVYWFYWIIYDLLKTSNVNNIDTDLQISISDYIEAAIQCSTYLDPNNDYVQNWYSLLQSQILSRTDASNDLLNRYIKSLPISSFSKEKRTDNDHNLHPSLYENCLANIAKAYIRMQQYQDAYRVVLTALNQTKSWYLFQQRAFLDCILDREEQALYWLFRALCYFNSDWKYSVRLFHESLLLLQEFHYSEALNSGYHIYKKICDDQKWKIDENIIIDSKNSATYSADIDTNAVYSDFITAFKNALQDLFKSKLRLGKIESINQSRQGTLIDRYSNSTIAFSADCVFDLELVNGDYVEYIRSDAFDESNSQSAKIDFIFRKISPQHIVSSLKKSEKSEANCTNLATTPPSIPDNGLEKVKTKCSRCHKDIIVLRRTLRQRGLNHILCHSCFALVNILEDRGDPYYGLKPILNKIRDEHTMFDVHA